MSSAFYNDVYAVVRLIPRGRVTSYGAVAKYLGSPQSSRMVGWAMSRARIQDDYIPAHRVVNRMGMLTGKHHFEESDKMQKLLENEGIVVKEDQIQEFLTVFWDPEVELTL